MALSGAAAGAAGALADLQESWRRDAELQSVLASREFQQYLQQQQLLDEQAARAAATADRAHDRRMGDAQVTLSVLDSMHDPTSSAPIDVTAAQRAQLEGTPFVHRVKDAMTLPARSTAPDFAASVDATPQAYSYLQPTAEQQGARRTVAADQQRRRQFEQLRGDPRVPEKVRLLMDLEGVGVEAAPIGPSILETADDRRAADDRAFQNFTRRENYQDSLIRGRQAAGRAPAVTQQDRIDARREARRDAIAEYNARKDPMTGMGTVDLDELIEQYETEYLGLLEALETPEAAPSSAGTDGPASPAAPRAPIRRLTPMTPPVSDGKPVIRRPNGVRVLQPGELQRRPQGAAPAAGSDLPRLGDRRMIGGQIAEWDGQGWLPVRQ